MKTYQITFVWPNDDWTWIDVKANDLHQAILRALDACPSTCRIQRIEFLDKKQVSQQVFIQVNKRER